MEIENHDEIVQRISEFIDGTITEENQTSLVNLMRSDESIRDLYVEMMSIDSMLDWQQTGELDLNPFIPDPTRPLSSEASSKEMSLRRRIVTLQFSIAGLILLCLALGSSLFLKGSSPVVAASVTQEGEAVAYLARLSNVQWKSVETTTQAGELLKSGWLKFSSGRVELDFLEGSNVIIQGPAEVGLKGINRLYLKSGTIIAKSSSEKFFIETVSQVLVVENSLVGVSAEDAHSEFHLFSGTASFQNKGSDGKELKMAAQLEVNKAIKVTNTTPEELKEIEITPGKFPTFEAIQKNESRGSINFLEQKPIAYGYQDGQHDLKTSFSVSKDGNQLDLEGNSWKMIPVDAPITENTVLEFEFRSDAEGQIHGVGFDNDDRYHTDKNHVLFQIYGFEVRNGIGQQFNSYRGSEWKTFQIRVGRYIKGPHKYLYFVADDDVTGKAKSQFRNVKIFEAN